MLQHTTDIEARLIMAEWERQTKAISRATEAAGSSRGLRARLASHLAHLALAIHRDAAAGAGLQPEEDPVIAGQV
jgi:hypothetical protein